MGVSHKVSLVTGASSGIGEALSRELLTQGWTVIGVARSTDKLNQMAKELGSLFYPCPCDVSQKESVDQVSRELNQKKLIPSLFFLNAGMAGEQVIESSNRFDVACHEEIMAVNYFGVLHWIYCWEKICQVQGGANFVVTSSINAIFSPPCGSAYSASKAAISKAFEGLSLTYFGTNLKFSTIYAGPVDTDGLKGNLPFTWQPEKMAKYMIKRAIRGKVHSEPSLFYAFLMRTFRALPYRWTMALLKKIA